MLTVAVIWFAAGCDITEFASWAQRRLTSIALTSNYTDPCSELSGGFPIVNETIASTFLFHKDEHEVLPDWLQYHTYLVGFRNVHIIDDDSADPQVCKLLALYNLCGVEVVRYNKNFSEKHTILSNFMKGHNETFLIPMDADEFVTFPVPSNDDELHSMGEMYMFTFSTDREVILSALSKLPIDGRKYKFTGHGVRYTKPTCAASAAHPVYDPSYRRLIQHGLTGPSNYQEFNSKTFYHSEGFISTNQGNHNGEVASDNGTYRMPSVDHNYLFTNMSLLHFYMSSYHSMRLKYMRGAAAYHHRCSSNMYCTLAKNYQLKNAYSKTHYMQNCVFDKAHPQDVSMTNFTDWFVRHTKTFSELLGEPLSQHNYFGERR